jgi:cytochrome c556
VFILAIYIQVNQPRSAQHDLAIKSETSEIHSRPCAQIFIAVCATIVVCLVATGFGTANADIIADRKAGFKGNADSMKAIAAAIGSGDYQTVINRAEGIASWANTIPSYFPEGSDSGDTKARAEIWFEFDAFKAKAKANETAAQTLVTAAKSGDQGAMMAGLKNLGASCKSCHSNFKD